MRVKALKSFFVLLMRRYYIVYPIKVLAHNMHCWEKS
jgi:hypothetical protein